MSPTGYMSLLYESSESHVYCVGSTVYCVASNDENDRHGGWQP